MSFAEQTVDVLIVGGGPAGLAAAIALAGTGVRTLLCEKKVFPVDKACGEGIMPTGVSHLAQLGVSQHLATADIYPFVGVCYRTAAGRSAAATFVEGPGWGVRRTVLSAALLRRARELPSLEVRQGTAVKAIARTQEHIVVQAGKQRVRTRLLVGADGLNSAVRRWAGLERRPARFWPPVPQRWGARRHFHIAPWSEYVEVYWSEGVEAYVTPCGARQVGVAFLWDRARYGRVRGGSDFFDSLLQAFPALGARLKGVEPASRPQAVGPLYRQALAPMASGVLLIGDAAGYLDAITGEGISLATAAALSLEETVAPWLRLDGRLLSAGQLAAYAQAYQAILQPYYRFTWLALLLSYYPALAWRMVGALNRQPELFQELLSANMGLVSPWSLRLGARLLRGLLHSGVAGVTT